MRKWLLFTMAAALSFGADRKPLPGQAGNDDIEMTGSVLLDRDEIHQALGADLGPGYVAVKIKVTPKREQPLRIGPDDFTLISRKDGQKSEALSPNQIAGKGALVVKSSELQGLGSSPGTAGRTAPSGVKVVSGDKAEQSALLEPLKQKVLPDQETAQPVEGLLYFPIEGKLKPKDVSLIYKGPAGRLVMDFK